MRLLLQDYYFSDWTAEERDRGQHKSVMKCVLMTLRALHIHSALYWHSHAKTSDKSLKFPHVFKGLVVSISNGARDLLTAGSPTRASRSAA